MNPDTLHDGLFCIDNDHICCEDIPAVYEIDEEAGTATLIEFRLADAWLCDRDAAVKATGLEHVERQERGAYEAWREAAEDRVAAHADYLYEMAKEREYL